MPPKQQQRFHGNRANSMKIGLRGLVFTINPQNEPKAFRELSSLMEKVLAEYPSEYFQQPQQNQQQQNEQQQDSAEETMKNGGDDDGAEDLEGEDGISFDETEEDSSCYQQNTNESGASSGNTFADELQAELQGMKNDPSTSATGADGMVARIDSSDNNGDNNNNNNANEYKPRPKRNHPPRRFRMIDTNCKGFVFVSINFSDELEAADRIPVPPGTTDDTKNTLNNTNVITIQQQQVFNFCVGKIPSLILEIAKKIVIMIRESDVPLLRFTYYLYPCLSTAAPTVHSAIVLAEATRVLVPIPQGKGAARVETHFTVRNNSGVSQPAVLDELKKQFKERLPMSKFLVTNANQTNAAAAALRRQRENDEKNNNGSNPARVINASITYMVLHSVAMLCIQSDFSEMQEYALHRIGASFADSL